MTNEIRASHILVKTEQEAIDLYNEIISGETEFEDAAMEKSMCPSGRAYSSGKFGQ